MFVLNRCLSFLILCAGPLAGADRAPAHQDVDHIRHEVVVSLSPADHRIEGEDVISFPDKAPSLPWLHFVLHAGLEIESVDPIYIVEPLSGESLADHPGSNDEDQELYAVSPRDYRLAPANGTWPADPKPRLRFRGEIHHQPVAEGEEYARSFARSAGTIEEVGVMLSGSSHWLPDFGGELVSFRLTVTVPEGWDVVSQGERTLHELEGSSRRVRWDCLKLTDEVYLIAARFTEYSRPAGSVKTYAFLRTPDPNLAAKYLEAAAQYIEMYSHLIGPYPYKKFALVENFWETGYGMPSFTLLGPKVIRFPFILHSSFPHEILHNWWGNSVFVDLEGGNWSEGLTAYLADHLIKDGRGQGSDYRRDTLKSYVSYVREEREFPLEDFRSRHSSASAVIGYGKSLMVWHMLRMRLGDEKFIEGLRYFYRRYRFQRASFANIEEAFSEVAGEDLRRFFRQWVERTGAPMLSLRSERPGDYRLRVAIRQDQPGELYELTLPLAVTLAGQPQALIFSLPIDERESEFEFTLPAPALRVDLDPYFDVFRRLDPRETPPTLGDLFGAEKVALVLPKQERGALAAGWKIFAHGWSAGEDERVQIVREQDLEVLPQDRAVWVLGSRNRWRSALLPALENHEAGLREGEIHIDGMRLPEEGHSFAYAVRHPEAPDQALGWVGTDDPAALPGLARKLPHYGKYSYLAFSGDEPSNVAKGLWEAADSPLAQSLAPADAASEGMPASKLIPARATLPAREPLARLAPSFDPARLMDHVEFLAADAREGRGIGTSGLDEAGDYIARFFQSAGLQPAGDDGSYFQSWTEPNGPDGKPVNLRNVVAVLPGKRAEWQRQSVVLGAHYDHLGRGWPDVRTGERGKIHNGADDNASGVAVLLELATLLGRELEPDRSIVFVAFSGEEWGRKGSRHYVKAMKRWPAEEALAMLNLDSVGRLEGRKLFLLGAGTASEWIHIAMGVGHTTGIEANSILDDPGGSDQASFHEVGVPAVQIFTGVHDDYHKPSDDPGKVDVEGLVEVAGFVREMLVYLSFRDRWLTAKLETKLARPELAEPLSPRRVSLGTVPDFSFPGPGARLASVLKQTPAEAAGLREGDVIVAIDGEPIADLEAYADALRKHEPGDRIQIRIQRGEGELELEAKLVAR